MNLYLQQLHLGPMDNFVYLFGDPETKEAAVVDPAWNVPAILKQAQADGYRITHAFLSHGHYDHIDGVEMLAKETGATVCVEKGELDFIDSGAGGLSIPKHLLPKVSHEPLVSVGGLQVRCIPTPGHTPGARCMHVVPPGSQAGVLFTGDILFVGTIGRCDFPYSSPRDLFKTLATLKKLDDETVFYPGHDYGATRSNTLGREKKTNPFLLAETESDFLRFLRR